MHSHSTPLDVKTGGCPVPCAAIAADGWMGHLMFGKDDMRDFRVRARASFHVKRLC
jgi:hypothetical protein